MPTSAATSPAPFTHTTSKKPTCAATSPPVTLNTTDRVGLELDLGRDDNLYQLKARLRLGDRDYALTNKQLRITPLFIYHQDTLYPVADPQITNDIAWFSTHPQTKIAAQDAAEFQELALASLSQRYPIKSAHIKPAPKSDDEAAPRAQLYLDEQDGIITFRPLVQYPERLIDPESQELRLQPTADGDYLQHPRNEALEARLTDTVRALHPAFANGAPTNLTRANSSKTSGC